MYANGEERDDEQMAEYRARTLILRDDITEGKATLRIYDVRASDRGSYRCYFQGENFSENAVMELKVAGEGETRLMSRSQGLHFSFSWHSLALWLLDEFGQWGAAAEDGRYSRGGLGTFPPGFLHIG